MRFCVKVVGQTAETLVLISLNLGNPGDHVTRFLQYEVVL